MADKIQDILEKIKRLKDAGCIIDPLGMAKSAIKSGIKNGIYTKCSRCRRVFVTGRLTNGVCELCIGEADHA